MGNDTEFPWLCVAIGEMLETNIDYRGKTPPKSPTGIPTLTAGNVKNGKIDMAKVSYVSEETYESWTTRGFPEPGDVLITLEAPVGEVASFPGDQTYLITRRIIALRGKSNLLDNDFLKYSLLSPFIRGQLFSVIRGTTVERVLKPDVMDLKIPAPPFEEQRAIAHILGTLDDKIELNRRMNVTLEGMAQALFKSWFVDFDPVIDNALAAGNPIPAELADRAEVRRVALADGTANREAAKPFPAAFQQTEELGWIPEGWEASTIGEEVETVGGGTPSTKNPVFWNGCHPFCTPKDMSSLNSIILTDTARHLSDAGVEKVSSGLLPIGTVVMSSRAPIGYLAISEFPTTINQGIIGLVKNETYGPMFLLNWVSLNLDTIVERANGSTFLEISKKNFRPIPFLKPSSSTLALFTGQAEAIHERVSATVENTIHLTKLRDTLLPKLISGELRIPDAEKLAEEALA